MEGGVLMAEFLIQARGHWMDNMSQSEINALSDSQKNSRDRRLQLGDIVVIKPDGWVWGKEEKLPRFIVIKAPGVDYDSVKHLRLPLVEGENIKKRHKYKIPNAWLNQHMQDVVVLTPQEINWVLANIVEKI